jgi:shikimate kinase
MNETRPTQIPNRTVVLIGMMGAGKSSIGRRLARRLGMTFVDADQEIESAAGCTIPDIFKLYGEAAFREGERKVIGRLLAGPPIILATGGGAFMDDVTRAQIKSQGISVWLRAELDILLERVSRRDDRPLLKQGDPKEILTKLIAERYPVYGLADIIVDSGDGPHELVVEAIVDRLAAYDAETPRSQKIEAAR